MMTLGWNVSEPIQLVIKLCVLVDSLKNAPDDAKAFESEVTGFRRLLEQLDSALNQTDFDDIPVDNFDDSLRQILESCQDCVRRCEVFGQQYQGLLAQNGKTVKGARDATKWLWEDKKVTRLKAEINTQARNLQTCLAISN